jgi:hypothetical protein
MSNQKKATAAAPSTQRRKAAPRAKEIVYQPTLIRVPVDYEFIAAHLPKFHVKDLVVIAMAMGGRMRMHEMAMSIEFDLRGSHAD